jgi:hypothetical protein
MLNGTDGYSFLVTAQEGPGRGNVDDYFRIQIWDMNNTLVYDNQPGDPMLGPATTTLGGGSIAIHK